VADAGANGVDQCGREDMSLFHGTELAPGEDLVHDVAQRISLSLRAGVEEVRGIERVGRAELLVEARYDVVLLRLGGQAGVEGLDATHIRRTGRSYRPESKIRDDGWYGKSAGSSVADLDGGRDGLTLADAFVVGEDEALSLTTGAPAEPPNWMLRKDGIS
jgi:hypothetical protein